MRAFIAIDFSKEVKKQIAQVQKQVAIRSSKGNFTPEENFHLTLRFIGEVDEYGMESLAEAVEETGERFRGFDLNINTLGFFPRGDKSIVWVGVEKSKSLEILFANLEKNLMRQGFGKERQGLTPHITIGREVALKTSYDKLKAEIDMQSINVNVNSITLMESVRRGSKLIYKPVFVQKLK